MGRLARCTRIGILVAVLAAAFGSAFAQTPNTPNFVVSWVMNKTLAIGAMDSSNVLDMSNHRDLTICVTVDPPSGAAEPWSLVAIRAIGTMVSGRPDSNYTGILALQPNADHSYIGSAAGDSIGYGSWLLGTATTLGNGETTVRGGRPNSAFPWPHTWCFQVANKGQSARMRYVYFQARVLAAGGAGTTRVRIVVQKSN